MVIDLHVHTNKGASDSILTPCDAVTHAQKVGLDGVCLTEHDAPWKKSEFDTFTSMQNYPLFRGMEIITDLGHMIVFGLEKYNRGINRAEELRKAVDDAGGFMIVAHPFRMKYFPHFHHDVHHLTEEELDRREAVLQTIVRQPVFRVAHEIEVLNGGNSTTENQMAIEAARRLGMKGVAGSDSHCTYDLGCNATVFERDIENEQELIHELRAGRYYPASGFRDGKPVPYLG